MSNSILRSGWALFASVGLCLAGCSGGSDDVGQSVFHIKKAPAPAVKKPSQGGDPSLNDMVSAVNTGKAGPPVQLKFTLRERPQPGQPVDIDIAVVPLLANIERLHASFQAGDGLQLVGASETSEVEKPAEGVPIRDTVKVIPKRDGIFTVTAAVSVEADSLSLVRTFSIPLIAGEGLPELASKADGPPDVAERQASNVTKAQ